MKTKLLLLPVLFLFATSCQNHLKREDALSMIRSHESYPKKQNYEIVKTYINDVHTEGNGVTAILGEEDFKKTEQSINKYSALGLLKLIKTPHRQETTQFLLGTTLRTWITVEVSLTETGKKYLEQTNSESYFVNLWETDLNEITGIQEDNKTVKVDYTTTNKNITPFGEIFNDRNSVNQKSVYFSLYDDGWRLNN